MITDKTWRIDEERRDNTKLFHYRKVSSGIKNSRGRNQKTPESKFIKGIWLNSEMLCHIYIHICSSSIRPDTFFQKAAFRREFSQGP